MPCEHVFRRIAIKIQVTLAGLSGYGPQLAQNVNQLQRHIPDKPETVQVGTCVELLADIKVHEDDAFTPASESGVPHSDKPICMKAEADDSTLPILLHLVSQRHAGVGILDSMYASHAQVVAS